MDQPVLIDRGALINAVIGQVGRVPELADQTYVLASADWLNGEFASAYFDFLSLFDLLDWEPESNDCDKFATWAGAVATALHSRTRKKYGHAPSAWRSACGSTSRTGHRAITRSGGSPTGCQWMKPIRKASPWASMSQTDANATSLSCPRPKSTPVSNAPPNPARSPRRRPHRLPNGHAHRDRHVAHAGRDLLQPRPEVMRRLSTLNSPTLNLPEPPTRLLPTGRRPAPRRRRWLRGRGRAAGPRAARAGEGGQRHELPLP